MNLVLTITLGGDYEEIAKLTHPTIKAYADKIGADFHAITEIAMSKTTPHWEKFQIYYFLEKYDRILYIDTDIIVRDDTPNLFDIVPYTQLGMFNEGKFTKRGADLMIDICKAYSIDVPDWNGKYYNSGVMVISKVHRNLFKKPEKEVQSFFEQSYLNVMISKRDIDMFDLEHKFNRMTIMDKYTGEDRFASYMIHYAGWYWRESEYANLEYVLDLISKDLQRWENDKPEYKYAKHLYIAVTGGMGDQLCAEPVIRWMKEKLYPEDEMIVASHHPIFFKHIKGIELIKHGEANLKEDTPYYIGESLPSPDTITWAVVSHLLCHSVDYSSIALLKRTLPLFDRTIKYVIDKKDDISLKEKLGEINIKDYITIHPGRHWNSKTFPSDYWQSIIDGFGERVIVIGKSERGDPPFYTAGARGTVDVDCSHVIDMREKLSTGELAVLLSKSKCLISNDSFPIHLAGAFNNWITLIPSCKHPDHILPYRKGTTKYKTLSLYKKLLMDEIESRPTQMYETSAEIENVDWNKYLLDSNVVIEKIKKSIK